MNILTLRIDSLSTFDQTQYSCMTFNKSRQYIIEYIPCISAFINHKNFFTTQLFEFIIIIILTFSFSMDLDIIKYENSHSVEYKKPACLADSK